MKPEQKYTIDATEDFRKLGIRDELIPGLLKAGIENPEQLKNANPNKLFNDICGMRKKMKLVDVKNPTLEEVQGWIEK